MLNSLSGIPEYYNPIQVFLGMEIAQGFGVQGFLTRSTTGKKTPHAKQKPKLAYDKMGNARFPEE